MGLQATCHAGFIIAPAGDIWIIRWVGWSLLGMIVWWFACQILSQWSQKCKVISQFCNIASTFPLACLGAAIVYYELLKLGKKGFGFEFALFFNQIFSFSFTIGMELSVDFLQLLFSFNLRGRFGRICRLFHQAGLGREVHLALSREEFQAWGAFAKTDRNFCLSQH